MPKVSVVVPLYNKKKTIERCIKSVINQDYSEWELVVVNDGSTDGSSLIVESFAKIDYRIRLVSKENGGVSSARNRGVKESRSQWIVFLDADDYFLSTALSTFSKVSKMADTSVILANFYAMDEGMHCYSTKGDCHFLKYPFKAWIDGRMNPRAGATMYRKEVLERHPFDEALSRYEDIKFAFDVIRDNRILYTPEPVMVYTDDEKGLSRRVTDTSKDFVFSIDFEGKSFWERMALMHLLRTNIPTYQEYRSVLTAKAHAQYGIFFLEKIYSAYMRRYAHLRNLFG